MMTLREIRARNDIHDGAYHVECHHGRCDWSRDDAPSATLAYAFLTAHQRSTQTRSKSGRVIRVGHWGGYVAKLPESAR